MQLPLAETCILESRSQEQATDRFRERSENEFRGYLLGDNREASLRRVVQIM